MKILYTASEAAPFAKTGGLADVAGPLPKALSCLGHDVKLVMPKYAVVEEDRWGLKPADDIAVHLAGKDYHLKVWTGQLPGSTVEVLFLSCGSLFDRPGLYQFNGEDYPDNLERFSVFSRAVLALPRKRGWQPDLLHANDWQTALTLVYRKVDKANALGLKKVKTVFTIHNLGYQGLFPGSDFFKLGLPAAYFTPDALEFYGKINLLKAGLVFGDLLTTVSPAYGREIQAPEFGFGLEGVLQARREDLFGILNGVDYEQWDPSQDARLPRNYDPRDLKGKRACKRALQKECGFPAKNVPLIAMITRLTSQKGMDLVLDALDELMRLDLQLVVLGNGDADIEQRLRLAAGRYPEKLSAHLTFDEGLAHRIQAGADLFLMPSRYEPCGLNQLYSLRYGTIPIVRKTGGLADTVTDATPSNLAAGKATGFMFEAVSGQAILNTIRLALYLYKNKVSWTGMMQSAMSADFSWDHSAREYEKLYERLLKKWA